MKKLFSITLLTLSASCLAETKPLFEAPFRVQSEGQPILIPHGYAYPASVDLDKDGLNDLVVGEYRKGGELYFYKNIGSTTEPKYTKAQNLTTGGKILTVPGVGI